MRDFTARFRPPLALGEGVRRRVGFAPAAAGTLAGPANMAAAWFAVQLGLIARRDEK